MNTITRYDKPIITTPDKVSTGDVVATKFGKDGAPQGLRVVLEPPYEPKAGTITLALGFPKTGKPAGKASMPKASNIAWVGNVTAIEPSARTTKATKATTPKATKAAGFAPKGTESRTLPKRTATSQPKAETNGTKLADLIAAKLQDKLQAKITDAVGAALDTMLDQAIDTALAAL